MISYVPITFSLGHFKKIYEDGFKKLGDDILLKR